MLLTNELLTLRNILNLTQEQLAQELGVSYESVNLWEKERMNISVKHIESIYEFAEKNGIKFNEIYEQLFLENIDKNEVVLFHGAKNDFSLPVDFMKHSKTRNDFGIGFYLGTSFEQAATYITNVDSKSVYTFVLKNENLKIVELSVERDWMLAIAYYRGWINQYENSDIIKSVITRLNNADVIIAPIADNRMFDIISEFVAGTITDLQCEHTLSATNLGKQYVLKTEKAINATRFIKELYVCTTEKNRMLHKRMELVNNGIHKMSMARIEYKGKGKYIEELLK